MFFHNAVPLTPSKSPSLAQLLSCEYCAPVTPLLSAGLQLFKKSAHLIDSKDFSFPLFSYTCTLFCTYENSTLLFSCASALFAQNTRGGGCLVPSEPKAMTNYFSMPIPKEYLSAWLTVDLTRAMSETTPRCTRWRLRSQARAPLRSSSV